MNKLTKIDEAALAGALDEWFNSNKLDFVLNKNFWARNPVGLIIKNQLKIMGKWKHKAKNQKARQFRLEQFKKKQIDF